MTSEFSVLLLAFSFGVLVGFILAHVVIPGAVDAWARVVRSGEPTGGRRRRGG